MKLLRCIPSVACCISFCASGLSARQDADVARAQSAYATLDFRTVIPAARRALNKPDLSIEDRIIAYELLGFTYGALDSSVQAITAFRSLIILDPDREPDVVRVTPRITRLYSSALGQVLVVRDVRIDSMTFIGGLDRLPVRFSLSQPGSVVMQVQGGGQRAPVDSIGAVADEAVLHWNLMDRDSVLVPPGTYEIVLDAQFAGDQYSARRSFEVRHQSLDTIPHLIRHPDRDTLPEMTQPDRNWRPLGLATLYTALASGASLALENTTLGSPARREIGGVAFVAIVTGFVMSLRKPDPIPVPGNVLYNQLLREDLARLNAENAAENAVRRSQTLVTIVPLPRDDGS